MKNKTITFALLGAVAFLAAALLLGNRLGLQFAGGAGFAKHEPIMMEETRFNRGSVIAATDTFSIATHADAKLYLDKNTRLRFDDGRSEHLTLTLEDGRMFGSGSYTVTSRETKITINGRATIVHYPWDNTLAVLLFSGTGIINHYGEETVMTPGGAMSINTLEKEASPSIIDFSINTPAVVDFYLFVNENDQ